VPLLHVKDMGPDRGFTEVGDGTLNMANIVATAGQTGVRWLIIEHDKPTMPSLESAARSLANLRGIVGVGAE
jgi:sugar phosphate isomerase/epimerase